jgi:hypothetical protein
MLKKKKINFERNSYLYLQNVMLTSHYVRLTSHYEVVTVT